MEATLLVELLSEELPPKSLSNLSKMFGEYMYDFLSDARLLTKVDYRTFATPRRLAVLFPDVLDRAPDYETKIKGPTVKAGRDANGKPTEILVKWAQSRGVDLAKIEVEQLKKGDVFVGRAIVAGASLNEMLAETVNEALRRLPVAKLMRWGSGEAQFVRPAHRLTMLHGARVVPGKVLGLESGNRTRGHRFMGKSEVVLASADEYETKLRDEGMVIADFAKRRNKIDDLLKENTKGQKANLGEHQSLLDEVTALVEYPSVYVGEFERAFLEVPQECLILTMRQHQRYFPLFDAAGNLVPKFLIVSNMEVADPRQIIGGNQRVVRPRLEDARFFFNQDRKQRLEERVPQLHKTVYHTKLGSQRDRVERLRQLAGQVARTLGEDSALAERAAWLAKADLLTGMVGEFPELQGIMGHYYAQHDREPQPVAEAIEAHYKPRFSGDDLPVSAIGCCVALADKIDALVGLFGIGAIPTGEKDPYGLRRAALGVVRILAEKPLALDLNKELLEPAHAEFAESVIQGRIGAGYKESLSLVSEFILDRLRGYCREKAYTAEEIEAVVSLPNPRIDLVIPKLEALKLFRAMPEAESLAAANKRIRNILKQANFKFTTLDPHVGVPKEPAETILYRVVIETGLAINEPLAKAQNREAFVLALRRLATLKDPVDGFFDKVLVMAEDTKVRENRLSLLSSLSTLMNRVADISKLAA